MRSRGGGYTLVEVLIFVGLTSFLLVIGITNINRSRDHNEFSQAVRDLESRIRDIINDVPTGYFPTNDDLSCTVLPGPRPTISGAGGNGLGKSEVCLYVGKALQFAPDGNDDQILIYTLAGRRFDAVTNTPVQSIDAAQPVAVASTTMPGFPDSVQSISLQNGLEISRVFNGDTTATPPTPPPNDDRYGIVALLTAFEGSAPGSESSDAQAVRVGGLYDSYDTVGLSKADAVNLHIDMLTDSLADVPGSFRTASKGIVICLINDAGKRASLTVGASGSGGVKLDIDSYNKGCDN